MPNKNKVKCNISGLRNQLKANTPKPQTIDSSQHRAQSEEAPPKLIIQVVENSDNETGDNDDE